MITGLCLWVLLKKRCGILAAIVFALSFAGVYLGNVVLRKHLEKKDAMAA